MPSTSHRSVSRTFATGLRLALVIAVSLSVALTAISPAHAATVSELEKQKQQAQQEADALKKEKNSLNSNYQSTLKKYNSLIASIKSTKAQIASSQQEISSLATQLAEAQAQEAELKAAMKIRVKYMYERGNYIMLDKLFESQSISEFLNQARNISTIVKYDADQIKELEDLQATIQKRSEELTGKQIQLEASQKTLTESQDDLTDLVAASKGALDDKAAEVAEATGVVANYDAQIAEMKRREAAIEAANAAALANQAQTIVADQDTTGALVGYSQDDLKLLAAIIQAEADNQGDAGRLAVGSVVMNRVKHRQFPNTISGVVYQRNQFAPASSGRLQLILTQGPNAGCMAAAKQCIEGYRSFDYLFFCTVSYRNQWEANNGRPLGDRHEILGAHYFYIYNRNM